MSSESNTPRRLNGVVCVVTGAARGIGFGIAERLASEGGRVACLDVSSKRIGPAAEQLAAKGLDVKPYVADVGSRQAVQQTIAAIERDFGTPTGVLVNNAVWASFQPIDDIDEELTERMLSIGVKALIWTMQAAVPQMRRRGGGSIINISSAAAHRSMKNSMVYSAMKAGVLGLTRAAAVELSPERIRVNAVLPGMIGTEASKLQYDQPTLQALLAAMPFGHFGEPQDIAAAVAFLASEDGRYVQGAEIAVDGGLTVAQRLPQAASVVSGGS